MLHCVTRRSCVILAFLLVSPGMSPVGFAQDAPPAAARSQAPAPAPRPRIGVAFGGGAAKGIAHIGVIRWFEEHRIPVDFVAGTSMGGLVGGAYASGMSSAELEALMQETDWDLMFLADTPFRYKTFRRKEDARAYPGQIDFGLKNGLTLPAGLNAGQQVQLMLRRIAYPYYDLTSFDDLPTPFRSVSADLRTSDQVVMDSGSLASAMRATMAIPGVFTPVERDGRLLVDGGTLNNIPADVARNMGADVVIAVNVGTSSEPAEAPSNMFAILGATLSTMMNAGIKTALKQADIVVAPDMKGLDGMAWRSSDELIRRGYAAAEAAKDQLLRYAVDEATYAAWTQARNARRRTAAPTVAWVRVDGVPVDAQARIADPMGTLVIGRPFDRPQVEQIVLDTMGTDRYELIDYRLEPGPEGVGLVMIITPKSYGPPFLYPAVDLQNIDSNSFSMNLRARLAMFDTLVAGSELRLDAGVGTRTFISGEWYRRFGRSPVFGAVRGYASNDSLNLYDEDGQFLAEYRDKTTGAGFDLGLAIDRSNEIRLGYDVADVRIRRRIGEDVQPEAVGSDQFVTLRWAHDSQTSPVIPTRGVYSIATFRYYFDTPEIQRLDGTTIDRRDFPQAEARAWWFRRVKENHRAFVTGAFGTTFDQDPGVHVFRMGGPMKLGALNNDEIIGEHYLYLAGGLLYRWFRLPDVLGGNAYLGAWYENGSAFEDWDGNKKYLANLSGGTVVETLLGPFFLGGSVSLNDGSTRFYVSLAPFVF